MAKYVIDIPNDKEYAYVNDEKTFLRIPISLGENKTKSISAPTFLRMTPCTEPDRKAIEDEVWEFACEIDRAVMNIEWDENNRPFEDNPFTMTYSEAKAKHDAWRKQKDEICVGDEVELFEGVKGLVYIVGEEMLEGVYLNCDGLVSFCWKKKDCRKTGKHFDDIEELLKKMREE